MTPRTASATPGLARFVAPHVGLDDAGRDGVGADAARPVLHRQGAGHAVEGGLARRVHGPAGRAAQAADRADRDDRARAGGEHRRQDAAVVASSAERTLTFQTLVELLDGQRLAVLAQPDAGVVDEHVEAAAERVEGGGHGRAGPVGRAEVGGDDDRVVGRESAAVARRAGRRSGRRARRGPRRRRGPGRSPRRCRGRRR